VSKPTVQKSKLQQSYEQVKPSFKKTLTTTTQSKQTAPAKQTSSRNELSSEESNVQNYQRMLNSKYNAGLEADGAWGPKTQAAYEKYIKK
jgi:peptidoglycan hydrolase-like protein with peptidoglycan-binding domain